jgi:uncharacterized protein YndB with AHSA1/START domain
VEVTREITVDADVDEVWRLLSDPDELAAWVGDEVRTADVSVGDGAVRWTWAPGGVESTVELVAVETDAGTTVRVTESRPGATSSARACLIGDAWDDRLFGLELRCLRRTLIPA